MEAARPATALDLARLRELAVVAVGELEPTRGGRQWIRGDAYRMPLEQALAADDHHVAVGLIDDAVIGFALAHHRSIEGAPVAFIDALYVEEGARGVGVGEALMNEVLNWCRHNGCRGVDSMALPGNRAAKNFFETFGLTARAIIVHRALGDGS